MRGLGFSFCLLTLEVGSYNPELSCAGLVEQGFSWDRFRLDLLRWPLDAGKRLGDAS
eukprot:s665_g1.t1